MAYSHVSLESTFHIRLLTIAPSTEYSETIQVTLKQVSLKEKSTRKSYDALSYVWGSSVSNTSIVCDGRPLLVTQNCHGALLELRRRRSYDGPQSVWIDAICIDQGTEEHSLLERNAQVQQMGKVYAKARRVVIWLGPSSDTSTQFYKKLRPAVRSSVLSHIFETADTIGKAMILPKFHTMVLNGTKKGGSGLRELPVDDLTEEERLVMMEFAQNPWFKRVWTLQEVSFSRDAVVLWGRASVSLFSLLWYALTTILVGGNMRLRCVPGLTKTLDNLIKRNATALMIDYYKKPEWGKALVRVVLLGSDVIHALDTAFLEQLEQHSATVHQDKVFGLFSSLSITGMVLPNPDYRTPTDTIFEETTVAWMRSRQTLSILLFVDYGNSTLPSWTFDWYDRPNDVRSHHYGLGRLLALDPLYSHNRPRASAHSRVGTLADYEPGLLPLRGLPIGRIISIFSLVQYDPLRSMQQISQWIDTVNPLTGANHTRQAVERCLRSSLLPRTVVLGIDMSILVNQLFLAPQRQEFRSWLAGNIVNPTVRNNVSSLANTGMTAFRERLVQMIPFTLFALDSGHVGVGSTNCTKGDALYLLAGAPWPVVLRGAMESEILQAVKRYRYVAAVRLDGVMEGEAWPKTEEGLERIHLI